MTVSKSVSIEMIRRLPRYHDVISNSMKNGTETISSSVIAEHLNLESILVRKDLEQVGAQGKPRIGFATKDLIRRIEEFLGWGSLDNIVLVGCGSLGSALLGYKGFARAGFDIVAGFDADPVKTGGTIHGKKVFPMSKFCNLCSRMHIELGIISVPAEHAQAVADVMVMSGIRGIWNFSAAALKVPKTVIVHQEDIAASLVIMIRKLNKVKSAERSGETS